MKQFFLIGIFGFLTFFVGSNFQIDAVVAAKLERQPNNFHNLIGKQPVLIELFTSENCAVCPPADRNLTFLETQQPFAQADLITLSLHVDYSDSGIARDAFSSPIFIRRQDIYRQVFRTDTIYTPQMIVDGQAQFAGTDLAKVQKAIVEKAKIQKGKVELATVNDVNGAIKLQVKISDLPKHETSTVFLAVAEDNLASNINRGGSDTKSVFSSVVRELNSLGFLSPEQNRLEVETFLQFQPNWKMDNLKLIVFVQENGSRKIFGIGKLILTK